MGNGTSIGRVRGLGSSKHGAGHWLISSHGIRIRLPIAV